MSYIDQSVIKNHRKDEGLEFIALSAASAKN